MKRLFLLVFAAAMLLMATPASANVLLQPTTGDADSNIDLSFVIRNEQLAPTTSVRIVFPIDVPVPNASAQSLSGWTSSTDKARGPVASVTFRGGTIAPGATQTFVVNATMPNFNGKVLFRVEQIQDSGVKAENAAIVLSNATPGTTSLDGSTTTTLANTTSTTSTFDLPRQSDSSSGVEKVAKYLLAVGVTILVVVFIRARRGRS